MAIKGKTKAKSKKTVARGPKPVYVEPKPHLFRRRWFQVGGAYVLGFLTLVFGIWVHNGLNREHRSSDARALLSREQSAISIYKGIVDHALQSVGTAVPPSEFNALPDLATNLDGLSKGTVSAKDALSGAKGNAESAKVASTAIDGFDLVGAIQGKGFSLSLTNYLLNSKARMVDGLKLYEQVALMLEKAAQATGPERADLISFAQGVLGTAKSLFSDGYSDYINALQTVKLFQPSFLQPGQSPIPLPSPTGASTSPKPKPSTKASASPTP